MPQWGWWQERRLPPGSGGHPLSRTAVHPARLPLYQAHPRGRPFTAAASAAITGLGRFGSDGGLFPPYEGLRWAEAVIRVLLDRGSVQAAAGKYIFANKESIDQVVIHPGKDKAAGLGAGDRAPRATLRSFGAARQLAYPGCAANRETCAPERQSVVDLDHKDTRRRKSRSPRTV